MYILTQRSMFVILGSSLQPGFIVVMYVQSILSSWIQKRRLLEKNEPLIQIEPTDKPKMFAILFLSVTHMGYVQICYDSVP